ncbi:hypothetical protein EsH8_V_001058 [Colletotrichum jinshuiense]
MYKRVTGYLSIATFFLAATLLALENAAPPRAGVDVRGLSAAATPLPQQGIGADILVDRTFQDSFRPDSGVESLFKDKNSTGSVSEGSLFGRQTCDSPASPRFCGSFCCGASDQCCWKNCCPLGNSGTCCPSPMTGCCPNTDNCVPVVNKCCNKAAETCGGGSCYPAGSVCCGSGAWACEAGWSCCAYNKCCKPGRKCCNNEGCCDNDTKCCPGICCPNGYECGDSYGQCKRETTSVSTPTSTSTRTSSSSTASPPPQVTIPKIKTPKVSSEPVTSGTCASATVVAVPTSTNLPVLEFFYPGKDIFNDIPMSTCLGIRHQLGYSAQEIVLTYAGDGSDCANQRGRESGCRGCCKNIRKLSGVNAGSRTECDEFPYKSTLEGGASAWTRCVTAWENQLQGYHLNSWYSDVGILTGDQFIVRVLGLDCATVKEDDLQGCEGGSFKRQLASEGYSGTETTMHRTLDGKVNVVVVPFGDLDGGSFLANARMVTGTLNSATIIDGDGQPMASFSYSELSKLYTQGGMSMNWDLSDYVGGIGLIGETSSSNVNLVWNLTTVSGQTTSTLVPIPTQSKSGSPDRRTYLGSVVWLLCFWVLVFSVALFPQT